MVLSSPAVPRQFAQLVLLVVLSSGILFAQFETATVAGRISDPSGLSISEAQVNLVDIDRGTTEHATTDRSGLYRFASVRPGRYRIQVRAAGFRVIDLTGLTVNVQDHLEQNFKLTVGSVLESVTVEGGAPLVDTETASVSTVVDRQFAENLPMNGRSFQTLIQLTPGVVPTVSTITDSGQFSVNGQRASSNYWTVDGVSANIGITASGLAGNGLAGALPSFSVQGGTNSLVSVDALQEFRIQTSTFAPEFGRTPGGQVSILTRSGTNQYHGTLFDYLRNDVLDANDWFNGYTNTRPLKKAEERQNDFGGTFGGPILKNRTFFFFSYEGLRLRLPRTTLTTVPCDSTCTVSVNARAVAVPAMQPFLNAFPLPSGRDHGDGTADFNASSSDKSTLNATSLRIDHHLTDTVYVFARYDYSPSELLQRAPNSVGSLNSVSWLQNTTQTATVGLTWTPSAAVANDFRFNYSRVRASTNDHLDSFGGAVPLSSESIPFPAPFTTQTGFFNFFIAGLSHGALLDGHVAGNLQRQFNIVNSLSTQKQAHSLKFGFDYRRLMPVLEAQLYLQQPIFFGVPSAESASPNFTFLASSHGAALLFGNLGAYAQDTWRPSTRLVLTYGLRWDVDFSPTTTRGPSFPAVVNFNLNDPSRLAVAPPGTPAFQTRFANLAPRVGVNYQVLGKAGWETILRGGFGIFFDLATQEAGEATAVYPFGAEGAIVGGTFPPNPPPGPPPITLGYLAAQGSVVAFDPNLRLPYTLQWNVATEQSLGTHQSLTASYIGAAGRRLVQTDYVVNASPSVYAAQLIGNSATSDYNSLQVQFQRRLADRLQALSSFSWAHSIDTASASSFGNGANVLISRANSNRGPSDFDIRYSSSTALTYEIPALHLGLLSKAILRGWSVENIFQVRSASPVDVHDANFFNPFNSAGNVRPDVIPGQPLYVSDPSAPGRRRFNVAAFVDPPTTPSGCNPGINFPCEPIRQGDLGRNALRGFDAWQWDFAVHRNFPIRENVDLQFRAELFNILNHPNFGNPDGNIGLGNAFFGLSTQMLNQSLAGGNVGGGGFNPLYQLGGPRSVQFALKLHF